MGLYTITLTVGQTTHDDAVRLAQEVEAMINATPGSTEVVTDWRVAEVVNPRTQYLDTP